MIRPLLLTTLFMVVLPGIAVAGSSGRTAVVYDAGLGWSGRHAAEEFAKYANLLTGDKVAVYPEKAAIGRNGPKPVLEGYRNIVALGIGTARLTAGNAADLKNLKKAIGEDGFVIKTPNNPDFKGKNLLVITGVTGRGTLYGVYHYLENLCGVGFFWDGDRVPKIKELPIQNIDIVQKPRFAFRLAVLGGIYRGIDRYDTNNWNFDRWKRALDWLAKRKLNATIYHLNSPSSQFFGSAFEDAYPEIGPAPEKATYQGGFPAGWDWPPKYRTRLSRKVLDYGRKIGIKFIYSFDLSNVPARFKKAHPELRYIEQDVGYGLVPLYPGDEKNLEVMRKYGRKLIEYFGTDHLYASAPLCEATPGKSMEVKRELKLKAAQDHIKLITSIDPDAVWVTDSWAFYVKDLWTVDFVKEYLKDIPNDRFYIYDTGSELWRKPLYIKHNYFQGKPFAVGIIHAYGGDDNLFGSFQRLVDVAKAVAYDPKAANCTGLFGVPELFGDNVAYWHMFSLLAWNPDSVTVDNFIEKYTLERYGESAQPTMKKVWQCLLRSVHSNDLNDYSGGKEQYYRPNNPFYKFRALGFGCQEAYPLSRENEKFVDKRLYEAVRMAPELGRATELALSVSKHCKGNKQYENDLVDIVRTYLGYISDYHLCLTYKAFKSGDKNKFEKHSRMAVDAITAIQKILQTRPDFSIVRQIKSVMSVPGTNRFAPEMIRTGCVAADYANRDVTEQIRDYYIPLVRNSISVMRSKMKAGISEVALSEITPYRAPKAKQIREDWIKNSPAPGFEGGATIPAIREALASVYDACVIDRTGATTKVRTGKGKTEEWLPTWNKPGDR